MKLDLMLELVVIILHYHLNFILKVILAYTNIPAKKIN
jgi:hypothetical protein